MTKSAIEVAVGFSATFIVCMLTRNSSFTYDNGVIKGDIHIEYDANLLLCKLGINSTQPLLQ